MNSKNKEFRRLGKEDLIEIIYELRKSEEQLQRENETLRQRLADKELKISKAGSIAEAAMQVNGVFEAAQVAADQYLQELKSAHLQAEGLVAEAKAKAASIVQQAKKEREQILSAARTETASFQNILTKLQQTIKEAERDERQKP